MNASEQPERSSRVEREIREILEKADKEPGSVPKIRSTIRRQADIARVQMTRSPVPNWAASRIGPDIIKICGAVLLAAMSAGTAGLSPFLALVLAIASALLFFSLWFPSRVSRPDGRPRWRGQDLGDGGSPLPFGRGRNRPR